MSGERRSRLERRDDRLVLAAGMVMAGAAIAFFIAEKRRPLRARTQDEPSRTIRNLLLGAASMAVVRSVQAPVVDALTLRVERHRLGLAQRLPVPAWARDAAAFLLLDYTIYVWHVLTHKVPALWRFHIVHHVDLDLDTTTALRFHAIDMAVSIPWRAAQVVVLGASPRALRLWQTFFFVSVMFHHSNLRFPHGVDRALSMLLTTPKMHGIHHGTKKAQRDSNWSSGISLWDRLHGTLRQDIAQSALTIGVEGHGKDDARLLQSLAMPFRPASHIRP